MRIPRTKQSMRVPESETDEIKIRTLFRHGKSYLLFVLPAAAGVLAGAAFPFWGGAQLEYLTLFLQTYLQELCAISTSVQLLSHHLQETLLLLLIISLLGYSAFGLPLNMICIFSKTFLWTASYLCIFAKLTPYSFKEYFFCGILYRFGCDFFLLLWLICVSDVSRSVFAFCFLKKQFPTARSRHLEQLLGTVAGSFLWCLISYWVTCRLYFPVL